MGRTLRIDIFTDVVCPWCLVGSVRLDRALARLDDVAVTIEHHPFYLDPDTPEEGVVVAEKLRAKYGREPQEMWARVEAEAARSGVLMDLSRQPRAYPTEKAHTLIRLARDKGTQHALSNAIAAAYFLQYQDIGQDDVLLRIAAAHGFASDEAREALANPLERARTGVAAQSAAREGISGVPFFVFDRRFALSGAQPEEVFDAALQHALRAPAA